MPVFLMLVLLSFAGQTLAGTDTLPPASAAPQKKTEQGKDWKHMNRYKVWDANRKEFTYPENWVEPEKNNATALGEPDQRPMPKKNNK